MKNHASVAAIASGEPTRYFSSAAFVSYAARSWLAVALVGHWLFVAYVVGFYGPILINGIEGLEKTHLPNGFIAGDTIGNLAVAAHIVLAVVIIGGGPLQLVSAIRRRLPRFHRWLGRVYLCTAAVSSAAGLYMVWTRGVIGGDVLKLAITLDAALILGFGAIALYHAIARNIDRHRRWAMRLFIVASGVWFYRIGFMGWIMATGGAGIDFESFDGPFLRFWAFGQYLVPLAVLELYLRARESQSRPILVATGITLTIAVIATAVGTFAAAAGMWLPRVLA